MIVRTRKQAANRRPLPLALGLAIAAIASGCAERPENLLHGLSPWRGDGVLRANVLTDGAFVASGSAWNGPKAAIFADESAFVVYDLKRAITVRTCVLQADNNDRFVIAVSENGADFRPAALVGAHNTGGMQNRFVALIPTRARYLRLSPVAGDGRYGVSEFQVFAGAADEACDIRRYANSLPADIGLRSHMLTFGLSLVLVLLATGRRSPRWWGGVVLLLPVFCGYELFDALRSQWPAGPRDVSFFRAVIAGVALIAVARDAFRGDWPAPDRRSILLALGICAPLSVLAFYNLGAPQFHDNANNRGTYIHYLDLRQYLPTAKYFDELGYSDIYIADMAALIEDDPGVYEQIRQLPMRDLRTHRIQRVEDFEEEVRAIRSRFTPGRWQAYKADCRYLRGLMSDAEYTRFLIDYGGNATPVWLAQAHLLFNASRGDNRTYERLALLDPALLLLMFAAIAAAFGPRMALISIVVFGCNDFIMYVTNWGGAILRHDWLAYTGIGLASLKCRRWRLAGFFLGAATMIRAFPLLALAALVQVVLWNIYDHRKNCHRWPKPGEIVAANRHILSVAGGAVLAAVALFAFSVAVLPGDAWVEWYRKMAMMQVEPHMNHFSLFSLFSGWTEFQPAVLAQRKLVYWAAAAAMFAAVFLAARQRSPAQVAVLGFIWLPLLLYPQNYYLHVIIFFPLLATGSSRRKPATAKGSPSWAPTDAALIVATLALCVAQYFTVLVVELPLHFYLANVLLFVYFILILTTMIHAPKRNR